MPNLITHMYLAREIEKLLDDELKGIIEKHKDAFLFGSIGPDYLFALREMGLEIGRYPNFMQYIKQYEVFTSVAKHLNERRDPILISYILGLMCHYVADLHCHPYVNFFCEEGVVKDLRPIQAKSVHTLIESAGDEYICTVRMGYKNSNKYKPNKDLRTKKKTRFRVGAMYEEVINDLYGIPLPAKKAALSVELTRIFLAVANDPTGKLRPFVDKIEDKYASKKKFTALMRPPEGYGKVDYLNFAHKEWRVARNRDQLTDLDFMELIDTAINTAATTYIPMLYSAIMNGTEMDKSLFRVNYEGVDIAYIEEQSKGQPSPSLPVYTRKTEEQPTEEATLETIEEIDLAIIPEQQSPEEKEQATIPAQSSSDEEGVATVPEQSSSDEEGVATIPEEQLPDEEEVATVTEQSSSDEEGVATIPEEQLPDEEEVATVTEQSSSDEEGVATIPEEQLPDEEEVATIPEQSSSDEEGVATIPEEQLPDEEEVATVTEQSSSDEAELEATPQEETVNQEIQNEEKETLIKGKTMEDQDLSQDREEPIAVEEGTATETEKENSERAQETPGNSLKETE